MITQPTLRALTLRRHFPIRLRRWRFESQPFVLKLETTAFDEGLTLEKSVSLSSYDGNSALINLFAIFANFWVYYSIVWPKELLRGKTNNSLLCQLNSPPAKHGFLAGCWSSFLSRYNLRACSSTPPIEPDSFPVRSRWPRSAISAGQRSSLRLRSRPAPATDHRLSITNAIDFHQ